MSNGSVSIIILRNNHGESLKEIFEVLSEKLGLNLSHLIELDKGILKDSLIIFLESLHDNLGHLREQANKLSCVLALSDLEEVGDCLKSCQVNIQ